MQIKARNRYWQSETSRACTTWIQVHDTGTFAAARFVRVPTDDNLELSSRGIDVKLLNVVQNVYQGGANFGDGRHRQLGRPGTFVNVAPIGDDRRHSA